MYKTKPILATILIISCFLIAIGSVTAADNSTFSEKLTDIEDSSSESLSSVEEVDNLSSNLNEDPVEKTDSVENLSAVENSSEILTMQVNSTDDVLSSSASVSSSQGHTFYKGGYIFKVSAKQYNMIRKAINIGKKQKFLDYGFDYTVKTNKITKVKVVVKSKTYYKKVAYEGFTTYPNRSVKLANLNNYYRNGWKKVQVGYQPTYTKKWLGYNYVVLKKVYKKYRTVNMRVYARIIYVGSEDYVTGQHSYFPWVSFIAMKNGYRDRYLNGVLLR